MSWFRRLLWPTYKQAKAKRDHPASQAMPTVKFDPSTVTKTVKANLRRNIESLHDLEKKHIREIYEVALRSILAGRNIHMLTTALIAVEGISKGRAAEIARSLHKKATEQINRERQTSLGITNAKWLYANAPCMRDPFHPTDAEVQRDAAHKAANGKRYEISKGLFVDGKWTWPGAEDNCKCISRSIIPGLEEEEP
jgi:hypothetical protein